MPRRCLPKGIVGGLRGVRFVGYDGEKCLV